MFEINSEKSRDVVALGAAIVDILARVPDAFLAEHNIDKAAMTLVDHGRADAVHRAMKEAAEAAGEAAPREVSGGSAANTAAALASLGASVAFTGKTKDDDLGAFFAEDMRRVGVAFETPPFAAYTPGATARSMILVTPDAQRSMCTDLGVSGLLRTADLPMDAIADAKIVYLEGYLWDHIETMRAFNAAMEAAQAAGGKVALTLSDTFCVDRHRDSFRELVAGPVDLLFANEAEILALYETDDLDAAADRLAADSPLGVITRSEKGCLVAQGERRIATPAYEIDALVDTTGAGDAFAAGFLHGLTRGQDLEICAQMGCAAAAEVIQHIGARPEHDLKALLLARGLPV